MKIIDTKPNLNISSFSPKSRVFGDTPSMKVREFIPNAGIEKTASQSTSWTIPGGTPIGLLLALTYAGLITNTTYSGGISPNAKIITQ